MISNFEFRISNFQPNNPFFPKLAAEFGVRNEESGIPPIPRSKLVRGRKFEIRNSKFEILFLVLALMLIVGCAHRGARQPSGSSPAPTPAPTPVAEIVEEGYTEKGIASWYGEPYHGRRTASGEVYDMHRMTAAHKTLPFGSIVKVNRRDTGADVKVRVNDRGPFIEGRIIDLSFAAAKKIGLDRDGVAPVKIKVVGHEEIQPAPPPMTAPGESHGCFWVQVAAFSDRGRASRAESELEQAGEEAVMLEGTDGLWRVRVGPFDREKAAEKARNRVTDAWPGAHVVPCGG